MSAQEALEELTGYLDFSAPILNHNKAAGFMVRLDANGDPLVSPNSDLSDQTIVDVSGWAPGSAVSLKARLETRTRQLIISDDCATEYANAVANDDLTGFYERCRDEGGADPLRDRCSLCFNETAAPTAVTACDETHWDRNHQGFCECM